MKIFCNGDGIIKITLFILLFLCCIFYLVLGVYSYKMDRKSKINQVFLGLSICCSLWAGGYAMMLTSEDINIAFFWRAFAVFGYCFFNGYWLYITFLFNSTECKKSISIVKILAFIPATIFFLGNIFIEPSAAMTKVYYGWIDVSPDMFSQVSYGIWATIIDTSGLVILFLRGKYSKKNRVKRQTRIILMTCIISVTIGIITDSVLPLIGVIIFPSGVLTGTIALGGVYYAINKHKMMLTTPKYISEYIFSTVIEPIFILNLDFIIENCNDAALSITDYKFLELVGQPFKGLIDNVDFNFKTIMEKGYVKNVEVKLKKNDGNYTEFELSSTVIYDEYNDILGMVILLHDISERKRISEIEKNYMMKLEEANIMLKMQIIDRMRAEEQIRHFIYYDALTELPNRKMMRENLNMLLESKDSKFAVLFIDLDGFKSINDNCGHQVGDKVLKNVAATLKEVIGLKDDISRIGGDEFIILLRNLKSKTYAQEIAVRVQNALKKPFIFNGEHLIVGASIGISIYPDHGEDTDTLIKKADLAMYEVKKNGGFDYAIYSSKMNDVFFDKLKMKKKLNKALIDNEFIVYYQPIMDLKSMEVSYSEALIRWKHEDRVISPAEFIPIAKNVGEMVSIDNWVLQNACIQCKRWHELGRNEVSVSVNTSFAQLKQPEFVPLVQNILKIYSLPAEFLNIEITEDEAMEDFETIINVLTELKSIGVKISLDDFGTGYSSISYASRLPVDKLKIDRSLIMNLEKNYRNVMIVKAIINTGHTLGLKMVAEGIETEEQLRILTELECDYIQGYLIGKPMETTEFEHKFIIS
ncbi:EAL domain-containing protein [Clostridium sp.]|uniref:EAL domain-containing protein n=1 Tax=Clostridium sp. TaxID=1506 RepID=UPI00261F6249|nr:EAL domain-containing protein [Clostridium sp.]